MTDPVDNGGDAFPRVVTDWNPSRDAHEVTSEPGMTLRDYFAAKAMEGDISSMVDPDGEACGLSLEAPGATLDRLAATYYRMADAMLKARQS